MAVEEKATGAFAGRIGFANPEGWPGFELAWALVRSRWGRGYATEGAQAALTHAFNVLNKDHVISLIQPANHASIRVAERLGQRSKGAPSSWGRSCSSTASRGRSGRALRASREGGKTTFPTF